MNKTKCWFCDDTINKLTPNRISNGWDLITGNIDDNHISIIHCPQHQITCHNYLHSLILKANKVNLHYKSMGIAYRQLSVKDIPHLLLWRKIACFFIGHNIKCDDNNVSYCLRCGIAYKSFILSEENK